MCRSEKITCLVFGSISLLSEHRFHEQEFHYFLLKICLFIVGPIKIQLKQIIQLFELLLIKKKVRYY